MHATSIGVKANRGELSLAKDSDMKILLRVLSALKDLTERSPGSSVVCVLKLEEHAGHGKFLGCAAPSAAAESRKRHFITSFRMCSKTSRK
jgi:hypothetical protein